MKVLLINPPYFNSKYKFIGLVAPPLGIAYIAAVLEQNDIAVEIIDAAALEMSWETLEAEIRRVSPQLVAVTALTPTIGQALQTAELAKKTCPPATVVMGGYHPTFNYQEMLEKDYVDIVVMGEGEYTLLELVQTLEEGGDLKNVKGIAYQDVVTPPRPLIEDLDELPFPARHLLPMDHYKILNMKLHTATLISGRGCPMQCSFCASAALHGNKLRMRSAQNVVDEMEHLINDHDAGMIAFMDDTFTLKPSRVAEICDEIIKRDLDTYWGCTARADTLSDELLQKLSDSGCITLFLGVESADQQQLDRVNKQITIDKIRQAFKLSRENDIRTIASVVLGMPGDTKDSIERTIKFVRELNPSYALFSLATPYPGTRFYQEAVQDNLIKVKDWSKYTLLSPVLETVDCSLDELKKMQKKAFRQFYLRPVYLMKQVRMDGPILLKTVAAMIKEV
ncbi:B12-binding domain-containing radical SAM protein [Methanobacterium sp. BAmetb5]|uniref:B12-binding domain-containing radical SAM protein n=1 Tax=Methanobacterium sp. BAmetb5 TaxID=2025351 RepID=UPI000E99845A|nr:radical SAM protein [Methanobacterium sp. BAmetb5]AXV40743.1 MAG: B12-binding domain-containing radical SAM protein [Methanobacterium sp. BAmetb5]